MKLIEYLNLAVSVLDALEDLLNRVSRSPAPVITQQKQNTRSRVLELASTMIPAQIAKEIGISRQRVFQILQKENVAYVHKPPGQPRSITDRDMVNLSQAEKHCTRCGTTKPISEFYARASSSGRIYFTLPCRSCASKEAYERTKKQRAEKKATHEETLLPIPRHGNSPTGRPRGSKTKAPYLGQYARKLTIEDAIEASAIYDQGELSYTDIGSKYGVTGPAIRAAIQSAKERGVLSEEMRRKTEEQQKP